MRRLGQVPTIASGCASTTDAPAERLPCPKCGKPDAVPSINCACAECVAAYRATLQRIQDASRVQNIENLWRASGLSEEWRNKTFATFERQYGQAYYDACLRYATSFDENRGESLLLQSSTFGVGKTHLAVAIGNYVLQNFQRSVIFTTGQQLMLKLRSTFDARGSSEHALLSALWNVDLLILDDVGKEKWSAYVESVYYSVINGRYTASRPMILTTNLPWQARPREQVLGDIIGFAAISRLAEMCERLEITGAEDYRLLKAGARR